MDLWFEGAVALVTGGGDGIGRASARLFASRGAKVAVLDVREKTAAATAELIRKDGGDAIAVTADVADFSAVKVAVARVVDTFGTLDLALNNAGVTLSADSEWDDAAFERTIAVNLHGVRNCLKAELAVMAERGGGAIVNMASMSGLVVSRMVPAPGYTASKHAVIGLTKEAAIQYARKNIRVNAVCPGVVRTAMIGDVLNYSEDVRKTLENVAPLGRLAEPEEIAQAVAWLCSSMASYVTGHSLLVDGGVVCTM